MKVKGVGLLEVIIGSILLALGVAAGVASFSIGHRGVKEAEVKRSCIPGNYCSL